MHFSRAFIAAAAVYLCPLVAADDASTADLVKPVFTPTDVKAPFVEQFTDDWTSRWQASHAKKETDGKTEEEWAYVGTWDVEEPIIYQGIEGDKGLVLKDKAAHHAISAKFPKAINNKGKTLVVSYEVKFQETLECGGAYMKLLQDNKALRKEEFSNASPYVIMFGPDKCGTTNKVHFIFKHKNPKTGEYEEKHLNSPPQIVNDKTSAIYTLVVEPDQTFQILVNGEEKRKGSLLEDFTPAVNPEKEIDDSKDKKPEDWVENAKMPDPDATKPEDWDEDAPYEVVDEEAEKPADWLDDEPQMIKDPEADKPADWDDEEDGDWQSPQIPNPKCSEGSGCGKWEQPTKKNPAYKGKWIAPLVDNPLYKGLWKPRKIANPNYYEDKTPSNFEPIGAIGFELWTMQNNILFDNIYIGHSVEDANKFKADTWDVKSKIEKQLLEADKPVIPETKSPLDLDFKADPVEYIKQRTLFFIEALKADPVEAIKSQPDVAGGLAAAVLTVLAIIIGTVAGGASSPKVQEAASKAKGKATEAKDKAAAAVATGAEKAQNEVNKRTTRSSS